MHVPRRANGTTSRQLNIRLLAAFYDLDLSTYGTCRCEDGIHFFLSVLCLYASQSRPGRTYRNNMCFFVYSCVLSHFFYALLFSFCRRIRSTAMPAGASFSRRVFADLLIIVGRRSHLPAAVFLPYVLRVFATFVWQRIFLFFFYQRERQTVLPSFSICFFFFSMLR